MDVRLLVITEHPDELLLLKFKNLIGGYKLWELQEIKNQKRINIINMFLLIRPVQVLI